MVKKAKDGFSGPGVSVLARIRSLLPTLAPSEARVAAFILEHADDVVHMTVAEVAEGAASAESSTVRCCRSLGFQGFQDLKISLARDTASLDQYAYDHVEPGDAPGDVLLKVMTFTAQVIRDAAGSIDPVTFEEAVAKINAADEILAIGFGASYLVARSVHDQFASIGLRVRAPDASNLKYLMSRTAPPGTCGLLISHTGATRDLIRCAEALRSRGVPTVAITSFPRSRLADRVDHALVASGRELAFRFESLSGRLAHLAVVDALYLALARASPERARASLDIYYDMESSWRI
ncbi:MurR/RpiR family transcriptional regulator [Dactylosporangium sucinum]|uniref:RpiR family transcriptional regulator n=1 Tax=Dactylosporangium sucinum TaxID=1424081 RepID=A0A917UCQ9_9ACTN|nr:MurR/RpiR family transcriptional regulator [Dactylosporangium sucinum]GGM81405.1 RpiR family transcriptional regulator [Dactylosporangium sucinum]